MESNPSPPRSFLRDLLLILGTVVLIVVLIALVLGDIQQISNIFFIGSFLLWLVAAYPIFSELWTNAKITIKAQQQGENARELIKNREPAYQRRARLTYLFGLSGFICFFFAIVTLNLV